MNVMNIYKPETMTLTLKKKDERSKQLFTRTDVKDTPFQIITRDNISFGVFGKYKITNDYESINACEKELKEITWNRIVQVFSLINEMMKTEIKTTKI